MTTYLLDANVFIQAKNLHYGFDFCPAFWEWLIVPKPGCVVASIEKVETELQAGGDELSVWAKARGRGFFLPPDDFMLAALERTSQWASSQAYAPAAVAIFLQVADYWLVSHALAHGHVTALSTRKIKIPNACLGLDVPCISPYEMLRRERARFVLGDSEKGMARLR